MAVEMVVEMGSFPGILVVATAMEVRSLVWINMRMDQRT
jgi:hypothetical protein